MTGDLDASKLAKTQMASAYATIAELYMTPPLCDDNDAESQCENSFAEALKIDSTNVDALQGLANLRMLRDKDDQAKNLLSQVVDTIVERADKIKQ